MRLRPALLLLSLAALLACRQPPAELPIVEPSGAEPSGIGSPAVYVEAPQALDPGPILDWTAVDDRLAELIDATASPRYRIDYDVDHPWTGASSPLVTIVVFYDYQCPYSRRLAETLAALLPDYRDSLRVVWRQFPLPMHAEAELGSRFALAAHAQGQFEAIHGWLFENASSLSRAALERQTGALGLDPVRMQVELDSEWITGRVQSDIEFGRARTITSTPTLFVNGRPFRGAQTRETLDATIQEELAVAERLLAAGSDRREIWARFLAAAEPGAVAWPTRTSQTPGPDPDKRYAMPIKGLPPRGAARPKIEILMCGDFDCPYCARSTATLAELQKRHKKTLAIYFRHMPLAFHKDAMAAHRAAVAADNQGQFWAMFDLLYADQKARTAAELEDLAKQAGLDLKQFRSDVADPQTDAVIEQHGEVCQKQLDSRGTPTFFINGRPLVGAQPIDVFEAIIAEELGSSP
ncbi:MAG TPA: thioredoxin domain-containing protein [Enhygromyxa sp.]|nr:thioredoxin domain-containing protein [Enhygromyxa sp.]